MQEAKKVKTEDIVKVGERAKVAFSKILAEGKRVTDVISMEKAGKEWNVLVEVLEREAVPDTQDIIGKYELRLDDGGELLSYKRIELRRRADLGSEE